MFVHSFCMFIWRHQISALLVLVESCGETAGGQWLPLTQYSDAIMSAMTSQITGVSIVCSTFCSDADQRKHQSFASLALVRGIHRWLVVPSQRTSNAENVSIWWRHHAGSVMCKTFPWHDIIRIFGWVSNISNVIDRFCSSLWDRESPSELEILFLHIQRYNRITLSSR